MTGKKFDEGKPRMDLVPPEAVKAIASVLTFGAGKYGDRNWEDGMAWGRLYGALQRHLNSFWQGENTDTDPESGLPHIYHALCTLAMLTTYTVRGSGEDDRRIESYDRMIRVDDVLDDGDYRIIDGKWEKIDSIDATDERSKEEMEAFWAEVDEAHKDVPNPWEKDYPLKYEIAGDPVLSYDVTVKFDDGIYKVRDGDWVRVGAL